MKKIVISLVAVLLTLSLFAFVACDKPADDNTPTSKGTLTFVMPDGTPALAAAKLLGTTEIGGYKVLEVRDYNNNTIVKADGTVTETGLPKSNVLYYDLEDNAWCCARPSGTEPKIKFYMGVKGTSFEDADNKVEALKNDMMAMVE